MQRHHAHKCIAMVSGIVRLNMADGLRLHASICKASQEFLRSRSLSLDGACAVIKQAQITRLADVNSAPSCCLFDTTMSIICTNLIYEVFNSNTSGLLQIVALAIAQS